ncbi:eukaryotic translation initiation factor 3 subunit D [Phakopsora pachyrhizi]|nr:eukaryotic translation initiation factor 3 subunit D [Phakopsora pachyrhizi]
MKINQKFILPNIHDHPDAWGPSPNSIPDQFKDIPYAPFSKSDKLGRVVDWNADTSLPNGLQANGYQRGNFRSQQRLGQGRENYGASQAGNFTYFHEEDEASFNLVGGGVNLNRGGGGGLMGFNRSGNRGRGGNLRGIVGRGRGGAAGRADRTGNLRAGAGAGRRGGQWGRGGGSWKGDWVDRSSRVRESTVIVGTEWQVLEEIEFSRLAKLRFEIDADEAEDVASYGFLYDYDRSYDRINTKNPQPLQILDRSRYHPTASEDPVIQELASQGKAKVFTTDSILSLLMCATRSVYPWDIVIVKEGDKLFMDKREGGPFDFLSVNENAADPPMESDKPDSLNTPSALSLEATFINQNFGLQVVKEDPDNAYQFDNPNPFYGPDETEPCASAGLRYRKFDLSLNEDEDLTLLIRAEVDAVLRGSSLTAPGSKEQNAVDEDSFITIRTLNEFDSNSQGSGGAPNWRAKLDSQRGAVVATEMKNNSCKLAKWAVQSILAGADQMKMGYISRANPRDASRHVILGQQWFKPKDFASQINVNLSNGWGIVRTVIDLAFKSPDGKYLLMKDPNKPVVRFYKIPEDAFDVPEDDEDDDGNDEDEDEIDLGT